MVPTFPDTYLHSTTEGRMGLIVISFALLFLARVCLNFTYTSTDIDRFQCFIYILTPARDIRVKFIRPRRIIPDTPISSHLLLRRLGFLRCFCMITRIPKRSSTFLRYERGESDIFRPRQASRVNIRSSVCNNDCL